MIAAAGLPLGPITRVGVAIVGFACFTAAWRTLHPSDKLRRARWLSRALAGVGECTTVVAALRRSGADAAIRSSAILAADSGIARLVMAGDIDGIGAGAVMAGCRVIGGGIGGLCGLATVALVGVVALPVAVAVLAAGAGAADVALLLAATRRRRQCAAALPIAVELLAAGLGGGLPLDQALAVAATVVPGSLRAVLERVALRVATGVPAGTALREEAERTQLAALLSLALIIERSFLRGGSSVPGLHAAAVDLRSQAAVDRLAGAGRAGPIAALLTSLVIAPACVTALLVLVVAGILVRGGPAGL